MADSWALCADWGRVGVTKESVIHTPFGVFHKEINLIKFQKVRSYISLFLKFHFTRQMKK
jgi:hypothetical protein